MSTMTTSSSKSVRLPAFDGTRKGFQMWWTRFLAFAAVYKFEEALQIGGEEMPDDYKEKLDEQVPEEKAMMQAKSRNATAMANLTMAFQSEATMGLVYKAMDKKWPGGLAHKVVAAMLKKFQPNDTVTRVEMRQMLNEVSMKKDDDPSTIFEQLSSIENRYNTADRQMEQEDMIAVVLHAAPEKYQSVLTTEQRIQKDDISLEHLETAMTQLWRQTNT